MQGEIDNFTRGEIWPTWGWIDANDSSLTADTYLNPV